MTAALPLSVLVLADSESYLKWGARLLDSLPGADRQIALVRTPILPTDEQIAHALTGSTWADSHPQVIDRRAIGELLSSTGCDVVIAAATGPVVQQIYGSAALLPQRPGLVAGLPGIGLPATAKGQRYRRIGDMFLTHSYREAQEYRQVMQKLRIPAQVVVTRLPMLSSLEPPFPVKAPVTTLVFAPQAKVPPAKEDRVAILHALSAWCEKDPHRSAVVKLRSREGEQETHIEAYPYRDLVPQLQGRLCSRVRVHYGPLSDYLVQGSALVTVSSTAALESLDRGLPTAIISDFGVDEDMLNIAFAGSGMERTLAEISAGDLPFPDRAWLARNYFHTPDAALSDALILLAKRARQQQLPDIRKAARVQDLRRVRAELRTWAPDPVVSAYRAARKAALRH